MVLIAAIKCFWSLSNIMSSKILSKNNNIFNINPTSPFLWLRKMDTNKVKQTYCIWEQPTDAVGPMNDEGKWRVRKTGSSENYTGV